MYFVLIKMMMRRYKSLADRCLADPEYPCAQYLILRLLTRFDLGSWRSFTINRSLQRRLANMAQW